MATGLRLLQGARPVSVYAQPYAHVYQKIKKRAWCSMESRFLCRIRIFKLKRDWSKSQIWPL